MNEKARKELIRQLVEGTHFWYKCAGGDHMFGAETPLNGACPDCDTPLERSKEAAEAHYDQLIDHAIRWGERE